MIEIQCLACEKAIKPQQLNDTDNYDTENYDGQVVCQECKSLLHVKSVKGKVQKSKIVENKRERDVKIIFKPAYHKESEGEEKELKVT